MRRDRLLALLALVLLIVVVKLGRQVYRWQAFGAERAAITTLEDELEDAGVGVIRTQLRADTLRRSIDDADRELEVTERSLDRMERIPLGGSATEGLERTYRRQVTDFNSRVRERNELVRMWQETLEANHRIVDRYNALADSIRAIAERMGEPYYPIRSPAEIATERGVVGDEG